MSIATVPIRKECIATTVKEYTTLKPNDAILVEERFLNYLKLLGPQKMGFSGRQILVLVLHQELEPVNFYSKIIRKKYLDAITSLDDDLSEATISEFISKVDDSKFQVYKSELSKLDIEWSKMESHKD